MKIFIYRNTTVEPLFANHDAVFSGYDDISSWNVEVDAYVWFYMVPFKQDEKILIDEINFYSTNLGFLIKKIPSTKPFYIFTLGNSNHNSILTGNFSVYKAINKFNEDIIKLADKNNNIKVIDINDFLLKYSINELYDWKYYYISKMLINPVLSNDFQKWFSNQINSIKMTRKKCIVLDLDNTLWGGVLGEDGVEGIKIGETYPGNAYYDFQAALLELGKAGIILTVCSKNNEKDVIEAWDKHQNILIKKEHLAIYRINWNNKAENIRDIISQLNIGADSVVFIDDNPTERELVKQFIPQIEVPDFPDHPYKLPEFIKEITEKFFRIYSLTKEDKIKTIQYKNNAEREKFKKGFNDYFEYLKSLNIKVFIAKAESATVPRIAQMTQKTNQFNLTTKRYTETDINEYIKKDFLIFTLKVVDRFGDNGITGLIIINTQEDVPDIDTFLLSCRILGKNIEEVFLKEVLKTLFNNGYNKVTSTFIKTLKNEQVEDLYDRFGFKLQLNQNNKIKRYELKISEFDYNRNDIYTINIKDNE